jgi:F0F1-type ATP synthase membrane subunit c/vacuolar-type H+-ATPase subunit K
MQNQRPNIEAQYKTLLILWAALLISQLIFIVLVFFTRPKLFQFDFTQSILGEGPGDSGSTPAMIVGFGVAAVTAVLFSFAFRRRLNERAVAAQDTSLVQTGLIIALAFCEVSSLFGLALAFAFDYQYFFLWFALGVLGMVLHFPKRDELHAASYKGQNREQ